METEIAKRWISKRTKSLTYKNFLLANLFYDGKIPKQFMNEDGNTQVYDLYELSGLDVATLGEEDLVELSYNSLRRPIKKKVNYILSKPYSVEGKKEAKEYFTDFVDSLKLTATEIYMKGEVWWEFEPDDKSPLKFKITVRKAESIVPHYTNEEETEYDAVGYLWNKIDENGRVYKYADFVDLQGRHRFPLSYEGSENGAQDLGHAESSEGRGVLFTSLPFIRLSGDSLYLLIRHLGQMYSDRYLQTDDILRENCDPIALIKNASETDAEIFNADLRRSKMVRVEGTGDFSYVSKSIDYSSLESFLKMVKSDIFDQIGVVSRESELNYVTSGRALDRLYADMDNDAAEMGQILKNSFKAFLEFIQEQTGKDYVTGFEVTFNTDKPTDETNIISNINSSSSLLSKHTLLKNHPWVEDVEEELKLIEEEQGGGNQNPIRVEQPYQDPYLETVTEAPVQEETEEIPTTEEEQ